MSFIPSTIPAGQVSLRGYQQNNIFRHAQGIEPYQQLVNYNILAANKSVTWELPIYFELQSIWIKTLELPGASDKVELSINSLIAGEGFTNIITLNLQARQIDSNNLWIGWEPPLTILPKGLAVKMEATVATEIMYLAGRECYLEPPIYPSIIES